MDYPGWAQSVLQALGAPVTAQNVSFLSAWHAAEESSATNNPLGTTAYSPIPATVGTGAINSAGVQNYSSPAAGTAATAAFLSMSNYKDILAALKSGNPDQYIAKTAIDQGTNNPSILDEIRTWGTHPFADHLSSALSAGSGGVSGFLNSAGGAVTGAVTSAAGDAAGAANSVARHIPGVAQAEGAADTLANLPGDIGQAVGQAESWLETELPVFGLYWLLTLTAVMLVGAGVWRASGKPAISPSMLAEAA
jgi:hypothetical protein